MQILQALYRPQHLPAKVEEGVDDQRRRAGKPAPPPRRKVSKLATTPQTSADSYSTKMSDEASSSKKSGKGSNNGNDSDSSLEISWSEQLKQMKSGPSVRQKQSQEFQCQVAAHMTRY